MTIRYLVAAVLFAATTTSFSHAEEAFPLTVDALRTSVGYFTKLDYDTPSIAAEIPALANQLIASADAALTLPGSDPFFKSNALVFIYAALYLDNELEAIRREKLPSTTLSPEEIKIREGKIIQYVERAKALLPTDLRMDSWVVGMKAKHLSVDYASQLVDMAEKRKDTFSLISALTITRNTQLTDAQNEVLGNLVKKFTQLDSPCFKGSTKSQCHSTPLAPFAAQSGIIMLADYRLKMTEKEQSERKRLLGRIYSRMLYGSAHKVWMKSSTPFWKNASIIPERIALTREEGFNEQNLAHYWKTPAAQVIYQCTSCHAPAVAPVSVSNSKGISVADWVKRP